jgi:superfamily II DNA/RNA helicase
MKYVPQHLRDREHRQPEPDFEVYLHRVGRAGRFGRKGKFPSSYLLSVV